MEGSSFDVDTGLGSQWPTEGTTTVPPHTIPKLQLQDEIFPIVQLPAAPGDFLLPTHWRSTIRSLAMCSIFM